MSEIECTSYKDMNKGIMKGYATIYVPKWGLEIFNIQMCDKDGARWINFPSRQAEKDGETKYFPYIRFRKKEHLEMFSKKVWEAVDRYLKQASPSVFNENGSPF